jgi:hypothetical protein
MKIISAGIIISILILIIILHAPSSSHSSAPDEREPTTFSEDVFPLIQKRCLPCHAQEERNLSRLFMDTYDLLMKGGYNGPPVKPGNAEESLITRKLKPNPPFGDRMPMRSKEYLTEEEIEIFVRWINEGAKNN